MAALERSRAIVLRTVNYGESDRVVSLLTRRFGKGSAFARGARKSWRRFGGSLELGGEVVCELATRKRGAGTSLWSLRSVQLVESPAALGKDLEAMARAHYALELCLVAMPEHHPDGRAYDLLAAFLHRCFQGFVSAQAASLTMATFEIPLLRLLGWAPVWTRCAECGRLWGGKTSVRFYPAHGGVLCPDHVPNDRRTGVPLLAETAEAMANIGIEPLPALSDDAISCAQRCLEETWQTQLGRALASASFLRQLRGPLSGATEEA